VTDSSSAGAVAGGSRRWAIALALLLFYGVLSIWVRQRWAASLLQCGIFLAAAVWIVLRLRRPSEIRFSLLLAPLAFAPLWGLLQLALGTTVYRYETWEAVVFWFALLAAVFLALQVLAEPVVRRFFLRALLVFGFAVCVTGITQYFTSGGKVFWIFESGYPDALGPFVYRNNYAAFVELLLPLAIFEALRRDQDAIPFSLLAGVLYASVIASASRAGSVLATAELVLVPALAAARGICGRPRLLRVSGTLLAAALVFSTVTGWETVLERLRHPDPFVHRREMLLSSLEMARERPLAGFGLGVYQEAYPAYALFDIGLVVNHAHNDWAEWLAEGGAPFLLAMAVLAGLTAGPAIRSVWGAGLLSVYLHALVDYPMQRLGLALWIFVLAAAVVSEDRGRGRAAPTP